MKEQIEEHIAVIEIENDLCDKPCDICKMNNERCIPHRLAKKLASEGYRKPIEGEWGYILTHMRSIPVSSDIICDHCFNRFYRFVGMNYKYCPNCGAQMKGATDGNKD